MKVKKVKFLIIGAGLSGLITANELRENGEEDFIILEARSRTGGRILTKEGIDLGATWFQKQHVYTSEVLSKYNLDYFEQFSKGKSVLVYNSMAPAHLFESDPNAPGAKRISGGSDSLIQALSNPVAANLELESPVTHIKMQDNFLEVMVQGESYHAEKVIICLPPKIAENIEYTPPLPDNLKEVMQKTHTWMSNAIKVGITYPEAFWKKKGLSGTIIGQIGPVIELYDHCNAAENEYSLMGFVNEGLREETAAHRKERILAYLEQHLGPEARNYKNYIEKDWAKEEYTSGKSLKSVYMSPQYGNSIFKKSFLDGRLYFSGTETSPLYGGYLEGAIYSGLNTAKKILS
ncbi:flavin monoamine oxidase family protein [Christiangramia forsetii]|uniref:Secreted flavin-containing amine oxidoreductase n=2 Tax=Christiangramia forsetii TaxID=411153 RepID=A0M2U4_CHRFK|nr:FAD-dependent oxidoreductase [Christiangramia forsetii]GGG44620.1 hypothetical protein GCM10011532_30760 [Christiangramia forsetii]CAL66939.1 secreted flavin-containing amine oxidoreductase [Christiangramia forsetii KT0803]